MGLQPEAVKAQGDLAYVYKYLMGRKEEVGALLSNIEGQDKRQRLQIETHEVPRERKKIWVFLFW